MHSNQERSGSILWVGGSSGLAHTYVNQFGSKHLVLVGSQSLPPAWVSKNNADYVALDLKRLTNEKANEFLQQYPSISSIVIGVRPRLVAPYNEEANALAMVQGIQCLLSNACVLLPDLRIVLHISSVAAADHLRCQSFASENDKLPPLSEYTASYDIFKRQCEDVISRICSANQIPYTHLRLSAIFSDDPRCIQCNALFLQSRISCFLPLAIDCNSGANVSRAIDTILCRASESTSHDIKTVYNYTRPSSLHRPVPYGYYLEKYRVAHGLQSTSIWIPVWIVTSFVSAFHWFAQWNVYLKLPYIDSLDYLLQVSSREHSFNCSLFQGDFPELDEETILECFVRRRVYLRESK